MYKSATIPNTKKTFYFYVPGFLKFITKLNEIKKKMIQHKLNYKDKSKSFKTLFNINILYQFYSIPKPKYIQISFSFW
jgi:hypothetical protein